MANFRDAVAGYFRSRPNIWIDAVTLESVGGRQAWRTRLSECRRHFGMRIENRQRTETNAIGDTYKVSEYRYVPAATVETFDIPGLGKATFIASN